MNVVEDFNQTVK